MDPVGENVRSPNLEEVPLFARLHRHGSQNDIEKANFDKLLSSPTKYFNKDNQLFGDPLNNNTEQRITRSVTVAEKVKSPKSKKAMCQLLLDSDSDVDEPPQLKIDHKSTSANSRPKKGRKKNKGKHITKPLKVSDFIKEGPHCMQGCKFNCASHASEDMLRCCICMRWVHPISCCGDSPEDASHEGIYTCSQCRTISDRISNLERTVDKLYQTNKDLIRLLEAKDKECSDLYKMLIRSSDSEIKDNNSDAKKTDSDDLISAARPVKPPVPKPRQSIKNPSRKSKVTVLGTSMVRECGSIMSGTLKTKDTTVYSVSGLSIDRAADMSQDIFCDLSKGDVAVLQVGTIDVPKYEPDILESKYCNLIDNVKIAAPDSKVVITAIPKRMLNRPEASFANSRTNHLNKYLSKKCQDEDNLIFIDANPDLSTSKYKWDGLHFNRYGTEYFAKFLSGYISHSENFLVSNSHVCI